MFFLGAQFFKSNAQREHFEKTFITSDEFYQKKQFQEALELIEIELPQAENTLSKNDTTYIKLLRLKVNSLLALERYKDCLQPGEELLEIRKIVFGDMSLDVVRSYNALANTNFMIGENEIAIKLFEKALIILKNTLGQEHTDVANNYVFIGKIYVNMAQYEKALTLYQNALAIRIKEFGQNHSSVAELLKLIANVYGDMNNFNIAIEYYLNALVINKNKLGEDHLKIADDLITIGLTYTIIRQDQQALLAHEQALNIRKKILGIEHPEVAKSLSFLASVYSDLGQYQKALELYKEALEIRKRISSEENPDIVESLQKIGNVYSEMGQYEKALEFLEKAFAIRKKKLETELPDIVESLQSLSDLYCGMGKYDKALEFCEQALMIKKKIFGNEDPEVATSLNSLGFIFSGLGQYEKALLFYEQGFEIYKKAYGEVNIDVALTLNNIGNIYYKLGQFKKALQCYEQALAIQKIDLVEAHPYIVLSLCNIGNVYCEMGEYSKALTFFDQSLTFNKKAIQQEYPTKANILDGLGMTYYNLNQFDKSLLCYEESYLIKINVIGEQHRDIGINLINLGNIYFTKGNNEKALFYFNRALEILKKVLGEGHQDVAMTLNNLGLVYNSIGQYDKSLKFLEKALKIRKKALGKDHYDVAMTLETIGLVYRSNGKFKKSLNFSEKAFAIYKKVINKDHPHFSDFLGNLGLVYRANGQFSTAYEYLNQSLELKKRNILLNITFLAEDQKTSFLGYETLLYEYFESLNLFHHNDLKNSSLNSFNNSLFISGFIFRSSQQLRTTILTSKDTLLKEDFSFWLDLKQKYAKALLLIKEEQLQQGIDIKGLEEEIIKMESNLIKRSQDFTNDKERVNLDFEKVRGYLNEDEVYIQFNSFNYTNAKYLTDSIFYIANIIQSDSKEPIFVELFEQAQLDSLMLVDDLTSMMGNLYQPFDSALYNLVWKPIARYLGDSKKVYIAPSGQLHKLAFAAIGDGTGHVLSDKYEIHQVLSAQDFVYPSSPVVFNSEDKATTTSIAMFGGINYDQSKTIASEQDSVLFSPLSLLSKDLNRGNSFVYLPATQKEIESIQSQFKQNNKTTLSYSGLEATEASLRSLEGDKAPKILHIATHGYFAPDPTEDRNKIQLHMMGQENRYTASDNPLLRSGLMMAGSNASWKGTVTLPSEEDGILTAQEVSNLNLLNTQLVVLSACETGLGDIKGREGVFGLQRAFRLAGAKYLLLSLWSIPDEETSEYMELFYAEVLKQNDISKAYKSTQTAMRQMYPNSPMKWAGMVLVE